MNTSVKGGGSLVCVLSQNRAKPENSTEVYPTDKTMLKKLLPFAGCRQDNKTCHRDRIACLSAPCPSYTNCKILLMPMLMQRVVQ